MAPLQYRISAQVGIQLLTSILLMEVSRCSTLIITSLTANSPTMMAMKSTPTVSVTDPKVSRSAPVRGSWPIRPAVSPRAMEMIPFSRARPERLITRLSPMNISAKYSGGPKTTANRASVGAKKVSAITLSVPATNEAIAAMASAGPAFPCLASS